MAKRYEIVLNDLLKQISSGKYKEGDMLPMEVQLTEIYGVSRITIQKAMNILVQRGIVTRIPGKGTFVKESKSLYSSTQNNDFYSIITPFQEPETLKIIQGVQKVMSEHGNYLTVHFTQYNENNEPEVINQLLEKGTNGIIVYAWQSCSNVEYYSKLQKSGLPIVFIDKRIDSLTSNLVMSDNFEGSYQGVEHLIKMGHKKIMFLSFSFRWGSSLEERFKGYQQCLLDHGIAYDENLVVTDIVDELSVNEALNNTLAKRKDVTACMCATDHMANKLYGWCHDNHIKIPRDLSVCGFDNNSYSAILYPSLTTIAQDFEGIGVEAANLVMELKHSPSGRKKVVVLPTTLVSRNSVADISEKQSK